MKKSIILTILLTTFGSVSFAQSYEGSNDRYQSPQTFYDYAKIISVTPEYQQVNQPTQVCRDEIVRETVNHNDRNNNDRNYGGIALGGIAGGLLGNQVGGGNGRTAATALGAVAGALVGDNLANNGNNNQTPQYQERTVQRCQNVDSYRRVASGYRVEYEYRGQINTFVTRNKPEGNKVKMNIQATPEM